MLQKMHTSVCLQKFVLMQPRTSPQKNAKNENFQNLAKHCQFPGLRGLGVPRRALDELDLDQHPRRGAGPAGRGLRQGRRVPPPQKMRLENGAKECIV